MYSDKITQNVALAVMKVMEEELSAKQKKIAAVAGDPKKIDAEDFKKLRKEDTVAEAKYEPAKPDAAAVLRRKKLQDIEDKKEKTKSMPSNVRKHEGDSYGGGKQKYDMDESMDTAKSLAQKGMKSEPGSMTSTTRDKDGKVTSFQVTGPMKKTGTSDPMARSRSLAQKGMKLPEETTFSGLLASIHENGLTAIHEMFVRESASEEEFNAELKIAQEKSEGKGKKAEIAKGQVQAVKNEETEVVEYELDVNEINGVKMETIDERSLTAAETEKEEDTVKSMKKGMAGFKERYGDRAKEVIYATATKQAKKGY